MHRSRLSSRDRYSYSEGEESDASYDGGRTGRADGGRGGTRRKKRTVAFSDEEEEESDREERQRGARRTRRGGSGGGDHSDDDRNQQEWSDEGLGRSFARRSGARGGEGAISRRLNRASGRLHKKWQREADRLAERALALTGFAPSARSQFGEPEYVPPAVLAALARRERETLELEGAAASVTVSRGMRSGARW